MKKLTLFIKNNGLIIKKTMKSEELLDIAGFVMDRGGLENQDFVKMVHEMEFTPVYDENEESFDFLLKKDSYNNWILTRKSVKLPTSK